MLKIKNRDGSYYFARGIDNNYTVPLTEEMLAEAEQRSRDDAGRILDGQVQRGLRALRSREGTPAQQEAYLSRAIKAYIETHAVTDEDGAQDPRGVL